MSEIIAAVIAAVIFFFLGIVFCALIRARRSRSERQRRISYEIPQYINCAKDIRENRPSEALLMIENKIYQDLSISMKITKKEDKHKSRLEYENTTVPMIIAWQQAKEYFDTYGLDRIRKDAQRWKHTAELFEIFQQRLKEVPLSFRENYTGENALPAPALEVAAWLDGPTSLEQLRGKVILLNFWDLGCETFKGMMPHMEKLKEKYGDKGLEIISIHTPCKDNTSVTDFFSKHSYTFKKALASFVTFTTYHLPGAQIPTIFLINKSGHVVEGPVHDLPDDSTIENLLID